MSLNKFGETELCKITTDCDEIYCISRDRSGHHVLRKGSYNGTEIFAKLRDDGRKNTKKERIFNASLLYFLIQDRG